MEAVRYTESKAPVPPVIKEELYRSIIQNAKEGFVILSIEGDILDANQAFSRMSGYSLDELLSMKIYDLSLIKMTPADYYEYIKDHIKQGGATFETSYMCKDGSIIDVKVSSKYLATGSGIFFSFYSDITEQKKRERYKERILEESEDRYRTLIELGTKIGEAVIMIQDKDGREGMHTFVNNQWCDITGYTRDELLEMSFFDLIQTEGRQASIERHRQKLSGKPVPGLFEMIVMNKNGRLVNVELTGSGTTYRNEPVNVVYLRDITSHKQMKGNLEIEKEKYQSFVDNVPVALWEFDDSGVKKIY